MESDGLERESGNHSQPTEDCNVTAVMVSDPFSEDCDVTITGESTTAADDSHAAVMGDDVTGSGGSGNCGGVPKPGEEHSETKLCGYLLKLGGPLKGWKSRWFVYEERNCKLYYYRTAQDAAPLGHFQLTEATFSYPLQGDEGTFRIQTPQRTFVLK
ncbi:hypothetical protein GJAV_G00248590, partial [Gymnothorax javanicus]